MNIKYKGFTVEIIKEQYKNETHPHLNYCIFRKGAKNCFRLGGNYYFNNKKSFIDWVKATMDAMLSCPPLNK